MSSSLRVGSYRGTGIGPRFLPSGGLTAKVVGVKANDWSHGGDSNHFVIRTDLMDDNTCKPYAQAVTDDDADDKILTIEADGFTVGEHLNVLGTVYYWFVLGGDDITTFTYVGDGLDDHDVTGAGFAPISAHVWRLDTSAAVLWRSEDMPDGDSMSYTTVYTDGIKSFISDGIRLGTNVVANENTYTYYGFFVNGSAWNDTYSWIGDSEPVHDVTGLSFQPSLAWVEGSSNTYVNMKFSSQSPGASIGINYFEETAIIGFLSNGLRVNGYDPVNQDGVSIYALCFGLDRVSQAALGSFVFEIGTDNVEPKSDSGWSRDHSIQQTRALGAIIDTVLVMAYGSNTRQFVVNTTPARARELKLLQGTMQTFADWSGESRRVFVLGVKTEYVRQFRARVTIDLVEQ